TTAEGELGEPVQRRIVIDEEDPHSGRAAAKDAHASRISTSRPMTLIPRDSLEPLLHPPLDPPPSYPIDCPTCGTTYDALDAAWCRCIVKERTLVCPQCQQCFCRSDLDTPAPGRVQ